MNDVLHMLLGAALVCLGVLTAAYAERVRQLRITRHDSDRPRTLVPAARKPPAATLTRAPGSDDVISALQGAGYKKALATQAALACAESEQATPEIWMAAALRRCAQGGSV